MSLYQRALLHMQFGLDNLNTCTRDRTQSFVHSVSGISHSKQTVKNEISIYVILKIFTRNNEFVLLRQGLTVLYD